MALAIDASTPASKGVPFNTTSVASNSFSPPAGSVIVLMATAIGPSGSAVTITSVTDSLGTHLGWTLLKRSNVNAVGVVGGTTEIWYAPCPNAQTNMTVTINYPNVGGPSGNEGFNLPIVFTGADWTQNGATVGFGTSSSTALPSQSVTTTRAGSRVIGVLLNYDNATGPTVPAGQTETINGTLCEFLNAGDADAFWGQIQTANTASGGTSVTINDTAPTIHHNMVVVEVLAAPFPRKIGMPNLAAVHRAAIW